MCEGGTNRSVGLARVLKERGHDAISVSWRWNSLDTIKLLCGWVDYVVVMEAYMKEKVPFAKQLLVCEVGPDRYNNPMHSELLEQCTKFCLENDW